METQIVPLGTASAIPTKERHLAATALWRKGRLLLFDCGEGTQMRLLQSGLNRARLDALFLTHHHGDHFYGTMGVISTLALLRREEPLVVVGPTGTEEAVRSMPGLANDWLPYDVEYRELPANFSPHTVYETDEFAVTARPVEHRVPCMGFRFAEKARPGHLDAEKARAMGATEHEHLRALKNGERVALENGEAVDPADVLGPERPGVSFAYVMDTCPCEAGRALADGVDLLLHEGTFGEDQKERSGETGHSTAREAAHVAKDAGAGRLLISHFSARYDTPAPLVEEAQAVFPNTAAAEELKRYVLDPREKTMDDGR
ncbi:MAG: ribonuclease Z [Bacteroidetes bacterium QS_8_68_15]|nr:MAG: ribonuclease Z [Bacteroidetes bacterium QS_8_68_15]